MTVVMNQHRVETGKGRDYTLLQLGQVKLFLKNGFYA